MWNQLKDSYEAGDLSIPHQFQVGDTVLIRRHRAGNLEPRWKGPYLVLLTDRSEGGRDPYLGTRLTREEGLRVQSE